MLEVPDLILTVTAVLRVSGERWPRIVVCVGHDKDEGEGDAKECEMHVGVIGS